jgi:hypothetical protein
MSEKPHDPNPLNPPTAEMREYWEALGRFIDHFARVEAHIAVNLWRLAGIQVRVAQALLSGVRLDHATGLIVRVLEATKAEQSVKDEYAYMFTQLGHINKIRNDTVHYGTEFTLGTEFKTTNKLVAYLDEKARETPISTSILNQMSDDLTTIQGMLGRRLTAGWVPDDVRDQIFGPPQPQAAWRYKPPSRASRRDKPRAPHPKPKRPRRSSPA